MPQNAKIRPLRSRFLAITAIISLLINAFLFYTFATIYRIINGIDQLTTEITYLIIYVLGGVFFVASVFISTRSIFYKAIHRHQASKETFTKVDNAIFQLLCSWAKRRHPNKGKQWIKEKYYRTIGTRRWVFTGEIEDRKGEIQAIQLYRAAMVHIQRYKLIKGEANPYDPRWEEYLDQRLGDKWMRGANRKKLRALWWYQEGKCPVCDQKITKETGGISITLHIGFMEGQITSQTYRCCIRTVTDNYIAEIRRKRYRVWKNALRRLELDDTEKVMSGS